MKLSDIFLRSLKAEAKPYTHADGGGLYIHVSPSGGKLWRMSYRFKGRQKLLSFGAYPAVSLKDARDRRAAAKELLAKDIDPGEHKKAVQSAVLAETENSFEIVAREWYLRRKDVWSSSHGEKIIARLINDIFPVLGAKPVHSITPPELLSALRQVEKRGAIETAHRIMQSCGQIFRYAIATGRAERDITPS